MDTQSLHLDSSSG